MGSQNLENSTSMDSDEFSNLIGHNYGQPIPQPLAALHLEEDVNSITMGDVMVHPWSPSTRNCIREEAQLFINEGIIQNESGPSLTETQSMGGSNSASPVNFTMKTLLTQAVSGNPPNPPTININIEKPAASLEQLQENI